jgi:hypothetical protein
VVVDDEGRDVDVSVDGDDTDEHELLMFVTLLTEVFDSL